MSEVKDESLTFTGSIAALQSAISFGVDGGARVKIDIPQSDRLAAATLIELQGCELEFTVKVKRDSEVVSAEPVKAKRRPWLDKNGKREPE